MLQRAIAFYTLVETTIHGHEQDLIVSRAEAEEPKSCLFEDGGVGAESNSTHQGLEQEAKKKANLEVGVTDHSWMPRPMPRPGCLSDKIPWRSL